MSICNRLFTWTALCIFFFVATIVVNYVSTTGGINDTDQSQLSAKYSTPITPPGWAFSIWGIIYLWQALWLLYLMYQSIRFREQLHTQQLLPLGIAFFIGWILSSLFNIGWIISFAFERLTVSAFVLIFTTLSLYLMAYACHKYVGLAVYAQSVNAQSITVKGTSYQFPSYLLNGCTLTLYKVLVNNGIAFYATWVSVASCLGIAIFLIYVAMADPYVTSLICLGILTFLIAVYCSVDFWFARKWLVDTYSPYVVLLWALSAISTNSSEGPLGLKQPAKQWIFTLIALVAVAVIAKIVSALVWYGNGGATQYASVEHEDATPVNTSPQV